MRVTIVSRKNSSVLVQWHEKTKGFRRTILPAREFGPDIQLGQEFDFSGNLELGHDPSFPWTEILHTASVDGAEFEKELHRVNIWTLEDALDNPVLFRTSLQAAIGLSAAKLLQAAKLYLENEETH